MRRARLCVWKGRDMKHSLKNSLSILALAATCASAAVFTPYSASAQVQVQPAEAAPVTGVPGWAIASDSIQADPNVVFGTLPNGMRYALQRHDTPKGDVAVRFAINAGSKDETDAQRGAAHFVEHMAFNGSKNIPEGQLLPKLQRLGLSFGADTNATTSLEFTSYKLDLPNSQPEVIDAALLMMREVADRLTIAPAAVERERGILLSEASVRNDPNRRRIVNVLETQLPGNRLAGSIAQDPDQIRRISAKELRSYYEGHYRPERATLVFVGNIDPAELQRKITAAFADWKPKGPAGVDYRGPVVTPAKPSLGSFVDPAIPEILMFEKTMPYQPRTNSLAEARRRMLEAIAGQAMANRFQPLALKPDSVVFGAQSLRQDLARNATTSGLYVVARDGKWREALALGEQELRRATEYGFTGSEIEEVKANIQSALSTAITQRQGYSAAQLAEGLIAQSLENTVPTAPEFDLKLYQALEGSVTPETVSAAFKELWQSGPSIVHVSAKASIPNPREEIAALLDKSASVAVSAPTQAVGKAFAYDTFGAPGTIVADSRVEDLGIRTVRFANGVQLNLKRTDFEPGDIRFLMEVGEGASAFPSDTPGLEVMTAILISQDGLKAHDATELRKLLAGHNVSLNLAATADALVATGSVPPKDLDLQLKLLAARLTATGFRSETGAQWGPLSETVSKAVLAQPLSVWQTLFSNVLAGGDSRMGPANLSQLSDRTFLDLKAALEPQLANGSVAISLVGDFDEATAIKAVAATLGALPNRPARHRAGFAARTIQFKAGSTTLTHSGEPDQGVVSISWPTTDDREFKDTLTRSLLAEVMSLAALDLVREKLGATYTPSAISFDQPTYADFGHLTLVANAGPAQMETVEAAFRKIANDMRTAPVSGDLLTRAREPILSAIARGNKLNSGWIDAASLAQSWPERLDRRRQREAVRRAFTPADIQSAAKRYLVDSKSAVIRVVPQPAK